MLTPNFSGILMVKILFVFRVSTLYEIISTFLVLDHTKSHGGNTPYICEERAKKQLICKKMSIHILEFKKVLFLPKFVEIFFTCRHSLSVYF